MLNDYKARMTGAGFHLMEMKKVAQLKSNKVSNEDIKSAIYDENIFQYKKVASIVKIAPFIIRRCDSIKENLLDSVLNETITNAKLINLLAIMEEDVLFKDFMIEIVGYSYKTSDLLFGKIDVNRFFNNKIEQGTNVANFSESTLNKLRQVYLKILADAGLLSNIRNGELQRVFIDEHIRAQLTTNGYEYYINLLEGK